MNKRVFSKNWKNRYSIVGKIVPPVPISPLYGLVNVQLGNVRI